MRPGGIGTLESLPDEIAKHRAHRRQAARGDLAAAGGEHLQRLFHGREAHVGREKGLLDGLEGSFVENATATGQVVERHREDLARAREPAPKAVDEGH